MGRQGVAGPEDVGMRAPVIDGTQEPSHGTPTHTEAGMTPRRLPTRGPEMRPV